MLGRDNTVLLVMGMRGRRWCYYYSGDTYGAGWCYICLVMCVAVPSGSGVGRRQGIVLLVMVMVLLFLVD